VQVSNSMMLIIIGTCKLVVLIYAAHFGTLGAKLYCTVCILAVELRGSKKNTNDCKFLKRREGCNTVHQCSGYEFQKV